MGKSRTLVGLFAVVLVPTLLAFAPVQAAVPFGNQSASYQIASPPCTLTTSLTETPAQGALHPVAHVNSLTARLGINCSTAMDFLDAWVIWGTSTYPAPCSDNASYWPSGSVSAQCTKSQPKPGLHSVVLQARIEGSPDASGYPSECMTLPLQPNWLDCSFQLQTVIL